MHRALVVQLCWQWAVLIV